MLLVYIAVVATAALARADPSRDQLIDYKCKTKDCVQILTTSNGAPVEIGDTTALNTPDLIQNEYFMESISHKVQERIPNRIVHTKGNGAFGYFEVTNNISDICRASVFATDGKKTPVFVRFSVGANEEGDSDTTVGPRGFAIKFYTDEGNFDIIGFNTPLFIHKEPIIFSDFSKSFRRNPVHNFLDQTMFWDFLYLTPELLPFFLFVLGDDGIPDGYRYMPGFGCHTYHVYNESGKSYYVRFRFMPDGGFRYMYLDDAIKVGCMDPDYAGRDLYNAIENGNYPTWTLQVQVLSYKDVKNCTFDPFDITKELPEKIYPPRTVGTLVLNRNPTNHYAQVEQAAFCPGNLVRGILGGPDKTFTARRLAYKAAQRYRLGSNFHNIKVNQPIPKIYTYNRDGNPPVGSNSGGAPNYYKNSFNGPVPYVDKNKPKLLQIKQKPDPYNFKQATERYNKLSIEERQRLIRNIVITLSEANILVQRNILSLLKCVDKDLAFRTMTALCQSRRNM